MVQLSGQTPRRAVAISLLLTSSQGYRAWQRSARACWGLQGTFGAPAV